jgi:hypothetical protein
MDQRKGMPVTWLRTDLAWISTNSLFAGTEPSYYEQMFVASALIQTIQTTQTTGALPIRRAAREETTGELPLDKACVRHLLSVVRELCGITRG